MRKIAIFALSLIGSFASAEIITLGCDKGIVIRLDRTASSGTLTQLGETVELQFAGVTGGMEMYQRKTGAQDLVLISPHLASGSVNQDNVSISEMAKPTSINCKKR